ncbi:MAG: hypothetical protein RBR47_07430 [Bacteroidales bacterium]|jgi:hypothetical protein|nr:hypothetical protein [Bacteroidales bacterium]
MKKIILLSILIAGYSLTLLSQQKYAVLICGQKPTEYYTANAETGWGDPGDTIKNEFWNDTYLMWEMLVFEKGYSDKNVFVLFANGNDYYINDIANRYNAEVRHEEYYPITDYSATRGNVFNVFEGLASGQNGFPKITQNDFLFVWTFGHGGICGELQFFPCLHLHYSEYICDFELAELVDSIPAYKKAFWMQQCLGGSFADNLQNTYTIFHSAGLEGQSATPADDFWDTENEIINSVSYQHGEFNFHVYSCTMGESPAFSDYYGTEPYSFGDLNADSVISLFESWIWERDHETKSETPLYKDLGNIGAFTSLEFPTLLFENIGTDGLQQSHRGIIGISKTIHVTSGCQLTLKADANIHLLNESKLIVDAGAMLVIEAGDTIIATNPQNQIIINGNISIGEDVFFTSENNLQWQGLQIDNTLLSLSLNNVDFENCLLKSRASSLVLDSCDITTGGMESGIGNISISNASFTNAYLEAKYASDPENFISVQNVDFNSSGNTSFAIKIESYPSYRITGSSISGFEGGGIEISNSGYSAAGFHAITNNIITANGSTNNTEAGLVIYHSYADVDNNVVISYNPYGIQCLNNSDVSITGNRAAKYDYQTQQIRDNYISQIYATRGSFPYEVKWNAIVDEDNDCLFHYETMIEETPYDVKYNYWGQNFNAARDLCPTEYFDYLPLWNLQPGGVPPEGAALAFENAKTLADSGNFIQSEAAYKEIVSNWPNTKYAQASLRQLFAIEALADNDYAALKAYYLSIDENETLERLATQLSAFCDLSLENWQSAIESFEGFIQNPDSYQDSLFAIIDLAHTYQLMELSNFKSAYTGKLSQYRYNSAKEFDQSKDYHISLLFGKSELSFDSSPQDQAEPAGRIIGNQPNPFSGTTQISFALNEDADINIYLINELGQRFEIVQQSNVSKGINRIYFSSSAYSDGMYVCVLEINGKIVNTSKIIIAN